MIEKIFRYFKLTLLTTSLIGLFGAAIVFFTPAIAALVSGWIISSLPAVIVISFCSLGALFVGHLDSIVDLLDRIDVKIRNKSNPKQNTPDPSKAKSNGTDLTQNTISFNNDKMVLNLTEKNLMK